MSLQQKAVKGVAWSAVESWGSQAISFAVFALLSRLLKPELFGLVAMARVFLAFVQMFLDQGFSHAIIQRKQLTPEHLNTAFWTNISFGTLLTLGGMAVAGTVDNFFQQGGQLAPVIRWLSLSFIISALSGVPDALLRRNFKFKALAIRSSVATVVGGCVGVAMAFRGLGVWSLVGQQLAGALGQLIVLWSMSEWRPGWQVSRAHFQELFKFGINIVGINCLNFINRRSDDLLIGYFLGTTALGYYTIAYQIYLIMTQLLTSVMSKVAIPIFSSLQQSLDKLRTAFYSFTELTSFVAFPVFIAVIVLAPELITFLFGQKWLPSVPVMQILSLIGIQHALAYFYHCALVSTGRPSWQLKMNFLDATTNFIAFFLVVRWGIVAVAAAYVIRGFLTLPINFWLVRKAIGVEISVYVRKFIVPLIASLIMVVAIWQAKNFLENLTSLPVLLSICTLIGSFVYAIAIFFIAPKSFQRLLDLSRLAIGLKA
jgi:O-antigen/teichoic acid export membrane protein